MANVKDIVAHTCVRLSLDLVSVIAEYARPPMIQDMFGRIVLTKERTQRNSRISVLATFERDVYATLFADLNGNPELTQVSQDVADVASDAKEGNRILCRRWEQKDGKMNYSIFHRTKESATPIHFLPARTIRFSVDYNTTVIALDIGIEGGIVFVHTKVTEAAIHATIQAIWRFLADCSCGVQVQRDATYVSPVHPDVGYGYAVVDNDYTDDNTWPIAGEVWHVGL